MAAADPRDGGPSPASPAAAGKSRLWLWVVVAFLVQGAAWTTWFVIASKHQVQEVPLAHGR
jgi:hypothetical protein